ncbi:hypothetical protein BDN72DRAFT_958042 [Pluteus cervinus]|uniref:Uncharacterized protein n=1 Tax=Pluteus cervinus TaxID=181527 RepID=A0ACD3B119_9AGAR|nr:hypothetical protein BDN72DRAFT_958042 [Pluteus cervinus]
MSPWISEARSETAAPATASSSHAALIAIIVPMVVISLIFMISGLVWWRMRRRQGASANTRLPTTHRNPEGGVSPPPYSRQSALHEMTLLSTRVATRADPVPLPSGVPPNEDASQFASPNPGSVVLEWDSELQTQRAELSLSGIVGNLQRQIDELQRENQRIRTELSVRGPGDITSAVEIPQDESK